MTTFAKAILAATLIVTASAAPSHAFTPGAIQTINVSSSRGSGQIDQVYQPNTGSAKHTRVCLVNATNTTKTFTHGVPGINALKATAGGQSCANFSSSTRVGFGLLDDGEPAQTNVTMVMSLKAFKGGTVTFYWK